MTRSVLESQISELQSEVDDAVRGKKYAECPPLQAKLDALIAKRPEFPTMEELEDAVKKAENDMAAAGKDCSYI